MLAAPALAELATRLAAQPRIGLDTEFLRERTYRAQLCLLQIASSEEVLCVDPLTLTELAPLAALLISGTVTKVMHASRQDLEVLLPLSGQAAPIGQALQQAAEMALFDTGSKELALAAYDSGETPESAVQA